MAFHTSVNSQITDAVAQANTKVLGDAPAVASGSLAVATSQSLALTAHNATNQQAQGITTMQAATVQAIGSLYSLDTSPTGRATASVLKGRGRKDKAGATTRR